MKEVDKSRNEMVVNDELIVSYLGGEASPEQAEALAAWMEQEENAKHFAQLERTWMEVGSAKQPPTIDKAVAWEKVAKAIDASAVKQVPVKSLISVNFAWRLAASLTVMAVSAALIYNSFYKSAPLINLLTAEQTQEVKLPDHSIVTLSSNTTLSYPESFEKKSREVNMTSGEAYFKIIPDREHPFIIATPTGTIKVVGTAFNVQLTDGRMQVSVSEGKVLIFTDTDSAYAEAGVTALVLAGHKSITSNDFIDVNTWGYATQKLVFKGTPMREVLAALEKTYQQKVNVSSEQINNCTLHATFDHESLEKLLTFVAESLNLTLTRNGTEYILQGEGCQ